MENCISILSISSILFCCALIPRLQQKTWNFSSDPESNIFHSGWEITILDDTFLDKDPTEWENDSSFLESRDKVLGLSCINDYSERAVALMTDYNKVWTQNEQEKQELLQVVENKRNKMKALVQTKPKKSSAFRKVNLKNL